MVEAQPLPSRPGVDGSMCSSRPIQSWFVVAFSVWVSCTVVLPPSVKAQEEAAPPLPTGPLSSASPDAQARARFGPTSGLIVESPSTASRFELHLATWLRHRIQSPPGGDTTVAFEVPLARVALQGFFLSERVHLFLQPELAGSPRLLDAFLELVLAPAARLTAGQFRTPFSRAFLDPIVQLQLPTRGLINQEFRVGRDTGLMLSGAPFDGQLEYYIGAFNGASINELAGNRKAPMGVARVVYNVGAPVPYGQSPAADGPVDTGFALGINGAYEMRDVVIEPVVGVEAERERWHAGTDAALMAGPVFALAEAFLRHSRAEDGDWDRAWGGFLQAGVFVLPRMLEVVARAGWMDPSRETPNDRLQNYEVGLSAYALAGETALGHHLKASLRYALDRSEGAFTEAVEPANQHRFVLQVQAWM